MGYYDSNRRWRDLGEAFNVTLALLKTFDVANQEHGERIQLSNGLWYYYHSTSVLTADDIFVIAPNNNQPGRYLLAPGLPFDIALPLDFSLADAAALATTPTGFVAAIGRSYWEITADWTGGSSSAIGVSTDTAPHATKGDLLGGAGGDVAATLVASAGKTLGTIGADVAGGVLLKDGVVLRYDEIVSAFTAGTGYVHLVGTCLANPGA